MEKIFEKIKTKKQVVKCAGGEGVFGHPLIYLNLGSDERAICPYCSKIFIKE